MFWVVSFPAIEFARGWVALVFSERSDGGNKIISNGVSGFPGPELSPGNSVEARLEGRLCVLWLLSLAGWLAGWLLAS